jgi:hypothetical protein
VVFYLVSWIALSCPGGMLSGLIPAHARPIVCPGIPASVLFVSEQDAMNALIKHGQGSTLQICNETKGLLRCEPAKLEWLPSILESK